LFDRPKPTVGCSANGRRRRRRIIIIRRRIRRSILSYMKLTVLPYLQNEISSEHKVEAFR
jgi:hypothetical protein